MCRGVLAGHVVIFFGIIWGINYVGLERGPRGQDQRHLANCRHTEWSMLQPRHVLLFCPKVSLGSN